MFQSRRFKADVKRGIDTKPEATLTSQVAQAIAAGKLVVVLEKCELAP